MKFLYIAALSLTLFSSACSKNEANAQSLDSKKKEKNLYEVKFSKLSEKYKEDKKLAVEDYYKSYIDKGGFSGGFLVAKNGEIIYEDYQGYSNFEEKEKITKETPMHVASVGKVITAVSVLRLADKNMLDLDQKVNTILEGFPYSTITIRNLLSHRSGIPYYGHFTEKAGVWDRKKTITNKDVLELLSTKGIKLDFTPDTRFTYSNTNYVLLALIVEKITKKPFKEALDGLIFTPLKMKNTFVFDDMTKKNEVTQSYYANNKRMHWDYLDGTYGDKNIYTTPRDLLKLDIALYSDEFLSKKMKEQMFKGYSYEKSGQNNYGLGLRMIEPNGDGDLYTFHNGWWRGNKTSYITIRKDSATIICFNNKNSSLAYKTKALAKEFGNFPFIKDAEE